MINTQGEFGEFLKVALKNNNSAIQFIHMLFGALHLWDDIIDKDREIPEIETHESFMSMLIGLPGNDFYTSNIGVLQPIILNTIINWKAANVMELMKLEGDLEISFILRSSFADIVSMSAFLIAGSNHAEKVALDLRRMEHSEGFDNYIKTVGVNNNEHRRKQKTKND